jgi:hypothetical protein
MADIALIYDALSYYNQYKLDEGIAELAADSSFAAGVEAVGTMALPAAVFATMLYGVWRDDQQVAEQIRDENTQTGIAQGLILGMLGWKLSTAERLFLRRYVLQIYQRQDLNNIRVASYNLGLRLSYHRAAQLSAGQRKAYLKACRKWSDASPGAWNERDQINYVIDLAGALRKLFMPLWETAAAAG